jgi:intermediate peptidase
MGENSGLFLNPYLTSASGLKKFSKDSLVKAEELCEKMILDKSETGLRNFVTNLDKLSDILCRVIDLAEFIRVAHPERKYVNAAQECHEEMFEFMNMLNTNVQLYEMLKEALTNPKISSQLTREEIQVGNILLADFEKSGINMDPATRDNFIQLSQQIAIYGQHFTNGTGQPATEYIIAPVNELKDLDKSLLNQIKKDLTGSNYKIPTWGHIPHAILKSSSNEALRKKIWIQLHSTCDDQVRALEIMLKYRGVLARMLGKESYAAYQLEDKMAKKPHHVMNFLSRLAEEAKPRAIDEIRVLAELKQRQLGQHKTLTDEEVAEFLKPWDRDYFAMLYTANQRSSTDDKISSYFSLGSVMQGLSYIFKSIYGIELIPENSQPGETWSPDVRRLNVVSEAEGLIGVVYCDLVYRQGKNPAPAHFTVCCSRKIYPDETEEDMKLIQSRVSPVTGERFQLPVISLVCGFIKNEKIGRCLLSLNEVETLFHEMGHAMHSMLARTSLHNTSGTRCATDFVELPSILMEHFSKDPRVVQKFARHYMTDAPIPLSLLSQVLNEDKFLQHSETYSQVKMALLDQLLHSDVVLSESLDSTTLYHGLEAKLRLFSDTESNWHGKFGHLYGYGGAYYAYLLDRAIASKVWEHLFEKNPLNRMSGEKLKQSVLKWGGSRDPWLCVADALDQPSIGRGDDQAMALIGEADLDN